MVKINIGGFELDSNKLPKQGLDYSKFNNALKNALSVFDTDNRKGHLSRAELQNAISFFASQDGANDGKTVTYHKKDGKIDDYEYGKTADKFDKKIENSPHSKQVLAAMKTEVKKAISEFIEQYKKENGGKLPPDELLESTLARFENSVQSEISKYQRENFARMPVIIEIIYSAIEAEKRGLTPTQDNNLLVFASKDNKLYFYSNKEFYPIDKKGTFSKNKKINDKGQQRGDVFKKDGHFVGIKALNYQNKTYIKKEFAAKVLGLKKADNGRYIEEHAPEIDGKQRQRIEYEWDEESHIFIQVDFVSYAQPLP